MKGLFRNIADGERVRVWQRPADILIHCRQRRVGVPFCVSEEANWEIRKDQWPDGERVPFARAFHHRREKMLQLNPPKKVYDVCIIGSGAGGGTAAKVLTAGGLNVVMLEAGPRLDPEQDFKEHVWPYPLPHR